MESYKDFSPSAVDETGLGIPNRQDWLVVPVGITRDSGPLSQSNFYSALESLGGESDTVEIHRFGHWAWGWHEIILVKPGSLAESIADDIEAALADYPVLDESDYHDREVAAADSSWQWSDMRYRVQLCQKYGASVFAARRDIIPRNADEFSEMVSELIGD